MSIQDKPNQTPGSMLEIYMEALANRTADDFLDQFNFGVGNYDEAEYWQQIQEFRRGLYADSAMTRKVIERAILETKMEIVDAVFEDRGSRLLDQVNAPAPGECCDEACSTKQGYFDEHIEDVWNDLGTDEYDPREHKAWLVHVATGLDMDWTPPHWRMLKAKHEASRSKDAHLIDNLFGRPPEPDMQPMEEFQ